jgi:hypothetical protein
MAFIQKYDTTAATKTHGLIDGTLIDLINPSVALNSTGELTRMLASGFVGWGIRGKREGLGFVS